MSKSFIHLQFGVIHHSLASVSFALGLNDRQAKSDSRCCGPGNIIFMRIPPRRPFTGRRAGFSPLALSCCVIYWAEVLSWRSLRLLSIGTTTFVMFCPEHSCQSQSKEVRVSEQSTEERACVLQLWDQLFFTTAPLALAHCSSHLS